MIDFLKSVDRSVFLFFNSSCSNKVFDAFYTAITDKYFWIIPLMLVLILYIKKFKKKTIAPILLTIIAIAIADPFASYILKPFFGRLRPCNPENLIEGAKYLLGNKTSFSFPSNHAVNVFAFCTVFCYFHPNKKVIFILIAVNIAFSRIYTGVHFPADVIAGALFGYLVSHLLLRAYNKLVVNGSFVSAKKLS